MRGRQSVIKTERAAKQDETKFFLEQQSSLELEEIAEEHREKLAEIDLKRLELEDELSEIGENAEESVLTRISPKLTIDKNDRTSHWVKSVDHN